MTVTWWWDLIIIVWFCGLFIFIMGGCMGTSKGVTFILHRGIHPCWIRISRDKLKYVRYNEFPSTVSIGRHGDLTFTALPHATSRDVVFNGYLIPKGATVIGDLDSVNQDRELWNDPEEFRPQRFIDETGSLTIPEQFVPFSLGRHSFGSILRKQTLSCIIFIHVL